MTSPGPAHPTRNRAGFMVLGLAIAFAAGVSAYLFLGSGDDRPAADEAGLTFDSTPYSKSAAAPTPYPNTGVLDARRPKEGDPAPDFALADAHDPHTVRKLSDFRGKAVIVNWYASWCQPCKAEIPEFMKAVAASGGQLVILGVDYLETPEKAVSLLDELGATYPAVLDNNGAVAEHYRVSQGLPTTFFIDKDGVLRAMKTGQVRSDELPGFLAKVGITYKP